MHVLETCACANACPARTWRTHLGACIRMPGRKLLMNQQREPRFYEPCGENCWHQAEAFALLLCATASSALTFFAQPHWHLSFQGLGDQRTKLRAPTERSPRLAPVIACPSLIPSPPAPAGRMRLSVVSVEVLVPLLLFFASVRTKSPVISFYNIRSEFRYADDFYAEGSC